MTGSPESSQDPLLYLSITIGYSDSEDRLWIRLVRPQGEAKLWMTRRLALALVRNSYDLLVQDLQEAEAVSEHSKAVTEFLQKQGDPAPPRNPESVTDIAGGLVSSVDISVGKTNFQWTFVSPQGKALFRSDRDIAHRLLEAFWARMRSSNWVDKAPWEQVKTQNRSDRADR